MKNFNLIADSSCDFDDDKISELDLKLVPFSLEFDGIRYSDDGRLSQEDYLKLLREAKTTPKTAAPSPYDFLNVIEEGKNNFIVTISSKLSAAYQSAKMAVELAKEKNPLTRVHVFDSKSASAGESLITLTIKEFIDLGLSFEDIIGKTESFINDMRTVFVLDSIDNLRKNGRMSMVKGLLAQVLSIKPVLTAMDGQIELKDSPRGLKKAHARMIDLIGEDKDIIKDRTLFISHAGAEEAANKMMDKLRELYSPKKIYLYKTRGLSTLYADKGGIIISY